MKYEGVSFNPKVILKFNTCEDFIFHKSYQHLWPKVSAELRRARLSEVYELVKAIRDANGL